MEKIIDFINGELDKFQLSMNLQEQGRLLTIKQMLEKQVKNCDLADLGGSAETKLVKWLIEKKMSIFLDADISKDEKRKMLNRYGYSSNILDE
jgi:hypothetical protein